MNYPRNRGRNCHRELGNKTVYHTKWYTVCCPSGQHLIENQRIKDNPKPKQIYLLYADSIARRVCCNCCYIHYLSHPEPIGFPTLNKALTALKASLIESQLTRNPHARNVNAIN